jgi:hypothetical protein
MNSMELWKLFENVTESYEMYLNPHPVKIIAQSKNKSVKFEINPVNIVCIKSDERIKYIYLKESIKSIDGELINSNKITINDSKSNLEALCKYFDSLQFRLLKVSKSDAVNVAYYDLNKSSLLLNLNSYQHSECRVISLGKGFPDKFKARKENFEKTTSLRMKEREIYLKSKFGYKNQ